MSLVKCISKYFTFFDVKYTKNNTIFYIMQAFFVFASSTLYYLNISPFEFISFFLKIRTNTSLKLILFTRKSESSDGFILKVFPAGKVTSSLIPLSTTHISVRHAS